MSDVHATADVALAAERRWAVAVAFIVVLLVGMMILTGIQWASMPPSRVETVDVRRLHIAGEFTEDNLGTVTEPGGKVVVRLIAQQYSFMPQCIVVPAGIPVTFRATSADVIHGFIIGRTNANTMLVPGFVTTFTTTFPRPGPQLMPCHEYCGVGHEAMWAHVQVIPAREFLGRSKPGERLSCAER